MDTISALEAARARDGRLPCYVRVTNPDHRGFIEFQFAVGDPSLYLEMTLPPAAFAEFCARHDARHLTAAEQRAVERHERGWRPGRADEDLSDDD